MFVDTDSLRMGADFSQSAGAIVQQGASQLASTGLAAGIFGDFDAAHRFQGALSQTREDHVTTMQSHRAEFDALAEKATSAAATFVNEDQTSATTLGSTGRHCC